MSSTDTPQINNENTEKVRNQRNIFEFQINDNLKKAERFEDIEERTKEFLHIYINHPFDLKHVSAKDLNALKNEVDICILNLKRLKYDPQVIERLKRLSKALKDPETASQIAQTTREEIVTIPPSHQKHHFAFVDGVCKSILPHLEELERKERSLSSSDSLERAINELLLNNNFPPINELDSSQMEDLHLALPQIIVRLRCLAPDLAREVVMKTSDFFGEITKKVKSRKDLIKKSGNKS